MTDHQLEVVCACGWRTVGTEDEVVEATTQHGVALHNMSVTREQVLAMSGPAPRSRDDEQAAD
jgi:hypothetical protein